MPNGGFESIRKLPNKASQLNRTGNWFGRRYGGGTPDFYYEVESKMAGHVNWLGHQLPHSGSGYAGIILKVSGSYTREYLVTKLMKPLIRDSLYYVEYYVSRTDLSGRATSNVDAALLVEKPIPKLSSMIRIVPNIRNTAGIVTDSLGWTKISQLYKASGGEEYIVLGLFGQLDKLEIEEYTPLLKNQRTKVKSIKNHLHTISMILWSDHMVGLTDLLLIPNAPVVVQK